MFAAYSRGLGWIYFPATVVNPSVIYQFLFLFIWKPVKDQDEVEIINPDSADIFSYKPWRPKFFFAHFNTKHISKLYMEITSLIADNFGIDSRVSMFFAHFNTSVNIGAKLYMEITSLIADNFGIASRRMYVFCSF